MASVKKVRVDQFNIEITLNEKEASLMKMICQKDIDIPNLFIGEGNRESIQALLEDLFYQLRDSDSCNF